MKDFMHRGGVIPEDAARKQLECIIPVIKEALTQAKVSHADIDSCAVTHSPGLLGSLLVGTTVTRVLGEVWGKPIIPVHHTLGHLTSTWLCSDCHIDPEPVFPVLTLSVSGGHTDLWYRTSHTVGMLIGQTIDDAAGEAFDKGAVLLGLPYPGGPELSKLAKDGNPGAYSFPHPLKHQELNCSFSGLKTSLKYLLQKLQAESDITQQRKADIASSYEHAIVDHLLSRVEHALSLYPDTKEVHCVGGVSANRVLREKCEALCMRENRTFRVPKTLRYCTDNAAMIASAGYYLQKEHPSSLGQLFITSATSDLRRVVRAL